MDNKLLINELEAIINKSFEDFPFPYVKGNSIRIGKMVIRKSKHGYLVYNTELNKQAGHTFSKASAIALAKNVVDNKQDASDDILKIDKVIEKNYMDSVYFKNSYEKSNDDFRKDVLSIRLDVALSRTEQACSLLDNYIYC
tara:strand:- start:1954 stop:2376 length:423 start_codon:yes stop_codon:yes gene_type:complete